MKRSDKFFDRLTNILTFVAGVAFVIILVCVVANVIGRSTKLFVIGGIMELVQYGMLFVMAVAIIRTAFQGVHVRVSVFTDMMPLPLRKGILFAEGLLGMAVFAFAGYQCMTEIPKVVRDSRVTVYYHIPYVVLYVVLGLGLFFSALVFLYLAFHDSAEAGKDKSQEEVNELVL